MNQMLENVKRYEIAQKKQEEKENIQIQEEERKKVKFNSKESKDENDVGKKKNMNSLS